MFKLGITCKLPYTFIQLESNKCYQEKIGDYDLIICGRQAIDGDTAQVGPEIAEFLNIPQVTYAKELELKDGAVRVKRFCESKDYEFEVKLPALITAIKELNTARYPSVKGIFKAYERIFRQDRTSSHLTSAMSLLLSLRFCYNIPMFRSPVASL